MSTWINGRRRTKIDCRDRGLQYGDGVFETMRVLKGRIRLLEWHLDRLYLGCRALQLKAPERLTLRSELTLRANRRRDGVLKLIITRGSGPRGYRPSGVERCTRIISLHALAHRGSADESVPVRLRVCVTPIGTNPALAGIKTLNRLESVLARTEWSDARIWDGLMRDADGNFVCGSMSNLFLRRGSLLLTPPLDRCGVAGVMRRWIMRHAGILSLRAVERRIRWQDLRSAEEVFMCNAVAGIRSVRAIEGMPRGTVRFRRWDCAERLRAHLDAL
jgi:4-amino-4-deoxychorismate lyase